MNEIRENDIQENDFRQFTPATRMFCLSILWSAVPLLFFLSAGLRYSPTGRFPAPYIVAVFFTVIVAEGFLLNRLVSVFLGVSETTAFCHRANFLFPWKSQRSEISLDKIVKLSVERTALQRILGVGDLVISPISKNEEIWVKNLPDPDAALELLLQRQARLRSNL